MFANTVAQSDGLHQTAFCEVVETELLGLHEGKFARYPIRPDEFCGMARNQLRGPQMCRLFVTVPGALLLAITPLVFWSCESGPIIDRELSESWVIEYHGARGPDEGRGLHPPAPR